MADGPEYSVERQADLFAAGDYPERHMRVTEEDIARLAAAPTPVPILVEHVASHDGQRHRWKLGEVASLSAAGRWLKGTLKLLPEAHQLLERIGVKGLSVTVPRSLDRLIEVSVTATPRVADAQFFRGDTVQFSLGEEPAAAQAPAAPEAHPEAAAAAPPEEPAKMADTPITPPAEAGGAPGTATAPPPSFYRDMEERFAAQERALQESQQREALAARRFEELRMSIMRKDVEREVDGHIASGKYPPAARDHAIALMLSDASVRFSDADTPVAELFAQFVDSLPRTTRKPLTGNAAGDPATRFSRTEAEFFAEKFPGLSLEDIAKYGGEVS